MTRRDEDLREPAPATDSDSAPTGDPSSAPTTDYRPVSRAVSEAGAAGFAHAGTGVDPDLAYLSRLAAPDQEYAVVVVEGTAHCLVPGHLADTARKRFPGDTVHAGGDDARPVGDRLAGLLADRVPGGTVLVPRQVPHDAAVYLERAGFDVASTAAVAEARTRKSESEQAALAAVQRAAVAGIDRASVVLAAATSGPPDSGATPGGRDAAVLSWSGAPLTAGRLRRQVDAALGLAGVSDAAATVVEAPGDEGPLRTATPVTVRVAPRGPHGYRGCCVRTFVVDGEGGWERRAHVAVTAARREAERAAAPDTPVRRVHDAVTAELAAYGFAVGPDADAGSGPTADPETGHGVGLAAREPPELDSSTGLRAGSVFAVTPAVSSSDGRVALADLLVVTDDGARWLADRETSLVP